MKNAVRNSSHILRRVERRRTIDRLLEADGIDKRSLWQSLKADAGAPTLKQIRFWTKRLSWLKSLDLHTARFFAGVPAVEFDLSLWKPAVWTPRA
jgi:hypothetical protein